ncbi:MAG: type II secretion system protein GspC [Magnetococcales bacterium]|nr:type II secretion system protein GspC [Magnetococcales bacterium]
MSFGKGALASVRRIGWRKASLAGVASAGSVGRDVTSGLEGGWLRPLALLLNVVLIVVLCHDLAGLTWAWVGEAVGMETTGAMTLSEVLDDPENNPKKSGNRSKKRIKKADWHLFGQAHQPKSAARKKNATPVDAPDTKLDLTLLGIVAFDGEGDEGLALIDSPSEGEKPYGIGDLLPGNAKVSAIHADRVILARGGRFETLRLPREPLVMDGLKKAKKQPAKKDKRKKSKKRGKRKGRDDKQDILSDEELDDLRQRFAENPESLLELVQVEPSYQDGRFMGFQLEPGQRPDLMKKFGLRAGDVVTSVNGVKMTDPLKGMEVLNRLTEENDLQLKVKRGKKTRSFNFTF